MSRETTSQTYASSMVIRRQTSIQRQGGRLLLRGSPSTDIKSGCSYSPGESPHLCGPSLIPRKSRDATISDHESGKTETGDTTCPVNCSVAGETGDITCPANYSVVGVFDESWHSLPDRRFSGNSIGKISTDTTFTCGDESNWTRQRGLQKAVSPRASPNDVSP
jgi:hypothetical protein